jgi:hypothetical protein
LSEKDAMASEKTRPIVRSFAERFDLDRIEDDRLSSRRGGDNCVVRFLRMKKFCFMGLMLVLIFFLDLAELGKSIVEAKVKTEQIIMTILNASNETTTNFTVQ